MRTTSATGQVGGLNCELVGRRAVFTCYSYTRVMLAFRYWLRAGGDGWHSLMFTAICSYSMVTRSNRCHLLTRSQLASRAGGRAGVLSVTVACKGVLMLICR